MTRAVTIFKPRAPRWVIQKLREALEAGKMTRASFGSVCEGNTETTTAYIKEETRLYRETWLIPRIQEALDWAEGKDVSGY